MEELLEQITYKKLDYNIKILNELKDKIEKELEDLSKGSIKERKISGGRYYYLQQRFGKKIVHKYLGKKKPEDLVRQIRERGILKGQLKKIMIISRCGRTIHRHVWSAAPATWYAPHATAFNYSIRRQRQKL